jgi:hypothetical protein
MTAEEGAGRQALRSGLLPVSYQTVRSQLKQFRHRFQVPVGFVNVHMPEVGRQFLEFSFDIESRSVPMDQRASGKSVAHIMEPWTTAMTLRDGAEAELLRQPCECVTRHPLCYPDSALRDEESRGWFSKDAVSPVGVLL